METLSQKHPSDRGFTLIELLVVIAIIATLAALLMPAFSRAKERARGLQCLSNFKQIILATHAYAESFGDWLPPNPDQPSRNRWVGGDMGNPVEATDISLLTNPDTTKLAPYLAKSAGIFKCPSDTSPHIRSYSMSQAVGTKDVPPVRAVDGPWLDGTGRHVANDPWRTYGRLSQTSGTVPAQLWIFIDENQYTINDAAFAASMALPTEMVDWPGTRHNFGAALAFADGHAELHRWTDARTKGSGILAAPSDAILMPDNADIVWLQQRTSALASGN